MASESEFLAAIQAFPGDEAAREVYADWLEERDDPRGEYLRLKLQAARLARRLDDLRPAIDPRWLAAVAELHPDRSKVSPRSTGRTLYLMSLRQFHVYAGLMEGLPTTQINRRIIENTVSRERNLRHQEPYLLQPIERPLEYPGDQPYALGEPAALPRIGCVGSFESTKPARDPARDASSLTIIWFQNHYAFPIAEDVVAQLESFDWETHAHDDDY